uniref:Endonuclease/exonuclease/phosphatase domain-containing protein n=1 Tax=Romanomermis culicivorax TaxID=13658 RepID=A0A915KU96_ROMCU
LHILSISYELPEDWISAAKAKALIQNEVLKDELFNVTMYAFLPNSIEKLEKQGLTKDQQSILPKSKNYKICGKDLVISLPMVSIYQTTNGVIWHQGLVTNVATDRSAAEVFFHFSTLHPSSNIIYSRHSGKIPRIFSNPCPKDMALIWNGGGNRRMVFIINITILFLFASIIIDACKDYTWYQVTSIDESDTPLSYATIFVPDVDHCAHTCLEQYPECQSAIFQPLGSNAVTISGGYCRFSNFQSKCTPGLALVKNFSFVASPIDEPKNLHIHCIYCSKYSAGLPPAAKRRALLSRAQQQIREFKSLDIGAAGGRQVTNVPAGATIWNVIRVMTFNTWRLGEFVDNGLLKIAKHIALVDADVVALQEVVNEELFNVLLNMLDYKWSKCTTGRGSNPILTKLPIVTGYESPDPSWNSGCRVVLPNGAQMNIWNVHLDYKNFPTYIACSNPPPSPDDPQGAGQLGMALFRDEYRLDEASSYEKALRLRQMIKLTTYSPMKENLARRRLEPTLLLGDFNSPSHLDWRSDNKRANCGWTFNWPVTTLVEKMGFLDSYRFLHKTPVKTPGTTWSPVYKTRGESKSWSGAEPQSRIDFIYYTPWSKNGTLTPRQSFVYHGSQMVNEVPDHWTNDWPSDHSAVVTDFTVS